MESSNQSSVTTAESVVGFRVAELVAGVRAKKSFLDSVALERTIFESVSIMSLIRPKRPIIRG